MLFGKLGINFSKNSFRFPVTTMSFGTVDALSCSVPERNEQRDERRRWLLDVCVTFVQKFVVEQEGIQPLVEQVEELEQCGQGRFPCRFGDCEQTYALHSTRVR